MSFTVAVTQHALPTYTKWQVGKHAFGQTEHAHTIEESNKEEDRLPAAAGQAGSRGEAS